MAYAKINPYFKTAFLGEAFGTAAKVLRCVLKPRLGGPRLSPSSQAKSQFLDEFLASTTVKEDTILPSLFEPDPDMAITAICRMKQQMEDLCVSLLPYQSLFQTNKPQEKEDSTRVNRDYQITKMHVALGRKGEVNKKFFPTRKKHVYIKTYLLKRT